MAKRLFGIYALVELAVIVALVATAGFGWTVLLLVASFGVGLALAGSQLRRQLRQLRSPLAVDTAVTDGLLVALGTVLVVIPGLASSVVGVLLLLPPSRSVARPLLAALAARRVPLVTAAAWSSGSAAGRAGRGDYIDGEVIDVTDDVDHHRLDH
jgi:UPF0716 protein FxsA